jgi:hypothetical protein
MQRIVRGLSATLTHTFQVDGVATDPSPDTATVTITRDDGTAVVTDAAATNAGTGIVSYTLTPAQTATLDILSVAWTATFGGQVQTFTDVVEVAGGVLFTIAEARALSALASAVTYPTAKIVDARTYVESELEQACGVAFVPRYGKVTVSGNGRSTFMLPPRLTAIRSVTLDGTSIGASALATIKVLPTGEVYYPSIWTAGYGNFVIAFEHGYSDGPERLAANRAALTWAKHELVQGPIDDRTTAFSTEDGTFSMSTPGIRGAITGIPAVDAFISRYSLNVAVA